MSTHKMINRICCAALALALIVTALFCNAERLGIQHSRHTQGYESRLFDTSAVHTIDIVMDDWEGFLETCENEEYQSCAVVIDGQASRNVGLRAKGNTSLSSVAAYGNNRYSFKIEFDHYEEGNTWYGLDKLCLNNIIQDNTYMKDYLAYTLMNRFGVNAPLCSYAYVTVNGEDWGLYLAVEALEESFLSRNYGTSYGNLYKPDSMKFGGGAGNKGNPDGMDFPAMPDMAGNAPDPGNMDSPPTMSEDVPNMADGQNADMPNIPGNAPDLNHANAPGIPNDTGVQNQDAAAKAPRDFKGMPGGGMGSEDVKLQYIDDDPDSYDNIFSSAKTNITDGDKNRLIASLKQLSEQQNIESIVDIDAVIRYFVAHNFVCNDDSYTGMMVHNYYLYEKDGMLSMLPWDYNLSFGGFGGGSNASSVVNSPIDSPVSGPSMDDRPMVAWIFSNDEYAALYHEYYQSFISMLANDDMLSNMIDTVSAMIMPYVEKDPTKFCTLEAFQSGVKTLQQVCKLRIESIQGQLNGDIPSTSEAQQNSQTLVDAASIDLSAMGSMGIGGGDGMKMPPDFPAQGDENSPNKADDMTQGEKAESSQNAHGHNNGMPLMPGMETEEPGINTILWLGISIVILLTGLLFAFKFKARI